MDSVVLKSGIGRMLSKKKKKRKMVQVRCNQTDFVQQSARAPNEKKAVKSLECIERSTCG